jgi:hypothetical protein
MRPRLALLLICLLHCAAVKGSEWERILIPIFYPTPQQGAYGSQWVTDLVIRNLAVASVMMVPPLCSAPVPSRFCTTPTSLPSNTSIRVNGLYGGQIGPVMLNVKGGPIDLLAANLRVRDVSRESDQHGTAIPVIRERDLRTSAAHFLDVPAGPRFRPMLRIYDWDSHPQSAFVVRVYEFSSNTEIARHTVSTKGYAFPPGEPIDVPGYVQVALDVPEEHGQVRLEIESLDGARYWAFVSVTANETQLVTIILPQ